jgi:hypothetical protein
VFTCGVIIKRTPTDASSLWEVWTKNIEHYLTFEARLARVSVNILRWTLWGHKRPIFLTEHPQIVIWISWTLLHHGAFLRHKKMRIVFAFMRSKTAQDHKTKSGDQSLYFKHLIVSRYSLRVRMRPNSQLKNHVCPNINQNFPIQTIVLQNVFCGVNSFDLLGRYMLLT